MSEEIKKFVFFGTSEFAVTVLETLAKKGILPTLVVTENDKPKGRGLEVEPTHVKTWAEGNKIPCITPEKLTGEDFISSLTEKKADFAVVAEYGRIIPKKLLDVYPNRFLNVHPSLLPKYRGPSPIQTAIINDEKENGVSIIILDNEVDHGPILGKKIVNPENWPPDYASFSIVLGKAGGELLSEIIPIWLSGKLAPIEQEQPRATFTKMISKDDAFLDLRDDPYKNWRKIQAFQTRPGTFFLAEAKGKKIRVKIKKARFEDGRLVIETVLPESKKEMSYEDFLRGYKSSR